VINAYLSFGKYKDIHMNDAIILQNGAGAFLENNGYYLLMKHVEITVYNNSTV
jgi:hypothetical protein